MKSIKLLKEAASVLGTPGDIEPQVRETLSNDISLFFEDQARRSADGQPGVRVSTDGENWEYTDNVHVVSRVVQDGKEEMKEFSITMTAGDLTMDVKSTIQSESSGNIKIDYEALSVFGLEGITITETGKF